MNEPLSSLEQFRQRVTQLREALQAQSPGYEQYLFAIHKQLSNDEEMTHLLSEEEIGVIVAALSKKKNIVIAEAASPKGKTTTLGGKKIKDIGLEDL